MRAQSLLLSITALAAVVSTPAFGVDGDPVLDIIADRAGTACVTTGSGSGGTYPGAHSSVGVGIAFDGTNLLISCYADSSISVIDPLTGTNLGNHFIMGAGSLGALAYDAGTGLVWGCSNFNDVGTIDLTNNTFTYKFSAFGSGAGNGCFDGLAFDASNQSLYTSGDVVNVVWRWDTAGNALDSYPITFSPGNSGIAVGGPEVFLANNGGQQIYRAPKDFSGPQTLFSGFERRMEDLECDDVTFDDVDAMWVIDAYDNILNSFEIPDGSCGFGGGGNGGDPCSDGFGSASGYNVYTLGSFTGAYSDVGGKTAAGGYYNVTGYGVGSALPAGSGVVLSVGDGATIANSQIYGGSGQVLNNCVTSSVGVPNGALDCNEPGTFDASTTQAEMEAKSDYLSGLAAQDCTVTTYSWGQVTLNVTGSEAVCNLDLDAVSAAFAPWVWNGWINGLTIDAPAGADVLVNVVGNTGIWGRNGSFNLSGGVAASGVLWHFGDLANLTISNVQVKGAVFAPKAAMSFNNGAIDGQVVVYSANGTGEYHNVLWDGDICF